MKAVIINRYGSPDVLQYKEVAEPNIKPDQLLIKVHATSVNPIDWKIRKGMLKIMTGNRFPMILGLDVSAEVVTVGEKVTQFRSGDQIYAVIATLYGGAYAESAVVSEKKAALKPTNMTYEQAAVVPLAALTALQALRDQGKIKPGAKALINGAAGGVGSFAVQIAKALGAEVTAVCGAKNMELVKSLGSDHVIDYSHQDFTQESGQYDIIFDVVSKQSFSRCRHILTTNGIYVATVLTLDSLLQGVLTTFIPGKKAKLIFTNANGKDLDYLRDLIEAGKIRSVIDRTYPLAELAAAHAYSEMGHVAGKIAIAVASGLVVCQTEPAA